MPFPWVSLSSHQRETSSLGSYRLGVESMRKPTEGPLASDGPCNCGAEGMELERTNLRSILTGSEFDCIRCINCKTVLFYKRPEGACHECGSTEDEEHMSWCSESEHNWPDVMFENQEKANYKR